MAIVSSSARCLLLALVTCAGCKRLTGDGTTSYSRTVTINGRTSLFSSKITSVGGRSHVEFSIDGSPTVQRDYENTRTVDVHPAKNREGAVEVDIVRLDGSTVHDVFEKGRDRLEKRRDVLEKRRVADQ
jgi:hypothetical protein